MTAVSEVSPTTAREATVPFWRAVGAIVARDVRLELRTRQMLSIMFLYALVVVILFNFALETRLNAVRDVASGLLWATLLLAATLGLNRSLAAENENNSLEAVLLAPVSRGAIYVGKVISVNLFVLVMEIILVGVFIIFFNKPFWRPPVLLILILGTFGFLAAGVLVTAMTLQARGRDVLLPVLLLPLSLPLVLPAATAVARYMAPVPPVWSEVQTAVSLVILYDIVMFIVGYVTFPTVVEM